MALDPTVTELRGTVTVFHHTVSDLHRAVALLMLRLAHHHRHLADRRDDLAVLPFDLSNNLGLAALRSCTPPRPHTSSTEDDLCIADPL